MQTITLDALIPREDFNILSSTGSSSNTRNKQTLSIEDLNMIHSFLVHYGNLYFREKQMSGMQKKFVL